MTPDIAPRIGPQVILESPSCDVLQNTVGIKRMFFVDYVICQNTLYLRTVVNRAHHSDSLTGVGRSSGTS